jgi:hypothetical protein
VTREPEQKGQRPRERRCVRVVIVESHTCVGSTRHCHHTRFELPGRTSVGFNFPFSDGCHSAARSGKRSAKDLPGETNLVRGEQCGHPWRSLARFRISAGQAWLGFVGQIHQALKCAVGENSAAFLPAFRVGCHCEASTGSYRWRGGSFVLGLDFAHSGHRVLARTRTWTLACHLCAGTFAQSHQTPFRLPAEMPSGVNGPLSVGRHSLATAGSAVLRGFLIL